MTLTFQLLLYYAIDFKFEYSENLKHETEQVKNKNKLERKIDRHKRKYIRQKDRKTK